MKNKFNWEVFLINILVPQFLGLLSAFFAGNIRGKYNALIKPPFSPPGFLFSVIWFIIFLLAGIASYIISGRGDKESSRAKFYYSAQLGICFLWNILFFGLEKRFFSFIWVLLLLFVLIKCFNEFKKISIGAAFIFIPYILWTVFAAYLTFGFWYLNN